MASSAVAETPKKSKAWIWGLVGCGCLALLVVGGGIVAAIAIPSLLRARIAANEAAAIGDIHTVVSAEMTYQSQSGGRYGTLSCLATPSNSNCIRGYSGPAFISPELGNPVKQGYRRTFQLSGNGEHFAYIAEPAEPGKTGVRSFCGDNSGSILQNPSAVPVIRSGECDPQSGSPLL
jgi:type IV pilus assembly protein PilA